MIYGIQGGTIPAHLPYAKTITDAMNAANFSPILGYAIAYRETIRGELDHSWCASTVLSADGGHGLFQLTSSWCDNWKDARANADYAAAHFLVPSMYYFAAKGMRGEDLVRCIAAGFNEGAVTAWDDHQTYGNVDIGTANHDYAADVLRQYLSLAAGQDPH